MRVMQKNYASDEMIQSKASLELSEAVRNNLGGSSSEPNGLAREFDVDCYLLKIVTCKSKKS